MLEIGTSGSVGGEGGNILAYLADPRGFTQMGPSVIFRKVTNCFRAEWGAQVYAAAASVMATGRLHGRTALEALRDALAGVPIVQSG